jgi:hypothetical protein
MIVLLVPYIIPWTRASARLFRGRIHEDFVICSDYAAHAIGTIAGFETGDLFRTDEAGQPARGL